VDLGLKTGVVEGPKNSTDGGTAHRIESLIFGISILLYTNLIISEKSPVLKTVLISYPCTLHSAPYVI